MPTLQYSRQVLRPERTRSSKRSSPPQIESAAIRRNKTTFIFRQRRPSSPLGAFCAAPEDARRSWACRSCSVSAGTEIFITPVISLLDAARALKDALSSRPCCRDASPAQHRPATPAGTRQRLEAFPGYSAPGRAARGVYARPGDDGRNGLEVTFRKCVWLRRFQSQYLKTGGSEVLCAP